MKNFSGTLFFRIRKYELKILNNVFITIFLILANLIGALIGFQYYFEVIGLAAYPVYLWILIPDCPMAVMLLIPVYLQRSNPRYENYNFFALIQGIRAAIITYLIVFNFGSLDTEIVIIGHTLLLIQALAIFPLLNHTKLGKGTVIAIFIIIFNDLSDFFGIGALTEPTLAQIPTIEPIFPEFVAIIYMLDLILIVFILTIRVMKIKQTKVSKNQ
ncbi:MAG: DUF1405 domain-containing protein [Candidatus Heimdallarchaeota archaeon]|nr:DUF1405 domain-containing protein [Candidatus Heimdallarchaeota archaeon]